MLRAHVLPAIGKLPLVSITPKIIRESLEEMRVTKSRRPGKRVKARPAVGTQRNFVRAASAVWRHALPDQRCPYGLIRLTDEGAKARRKAALFEGDFDDAAQAGRWGDGSSRLRAGDDCRALLRHGRWGTPVHPRADDPQHRACHRHPDRVRAPRLRTPQRALGTYQLRDGVCADCRHQDAQRAACCPTSGAGATLARGSAATRRGQSESPGLHHPHERKEPQEDARHDQFHRPPDESGPPVRAAQATPKSHPLDPSHTCDLGFRVGGAAGRGAQGLSRPRARHRRRDGRVRHDHSRAHPSGAPPLHPAYPVA